MSDTLERRHTWSRIVGVERRSAPLHDLNGRPLPNPTHLLDEDFQQVDDERQHLRHLERRPWDPWDDPDRFD